MMVLICFVNGNEINYERMKRKSRCFNKYEVSGLIY